MFDTVSPAPKFTTDDTGRDTPDGHTATLDASVEPNATTFNTTEPTPDPGTPPRPNTGTPTTPDGDDPEPNEPNPAHNPSAVDDPARESANRRGDTTSNEPPGLAT